MSALFKHQIGKTIEVYVNDMLMKSLQGSNHVEDLYEAFSILKQNGMSLNPTNCAFGVKGEKFLGLHSNTKGIKANPEKIQAYVNMKSLSKVNEVKHFAGRVAALNKFIY